MAAADQELLQRPLYVYNLPDQILESLSLKTDAEPTPSAHQDPVHPSLSQNVSAVPAVDGVVISQSCALCSLTFATVQEQRNHIKSDLHRYNLKQKLRGLHPVSEVDFERLIIDLDESLSGSDSSGSDEDDDDNDDRQESTLTALLKRQARVAGKGQDVSNHDLDDEKSVGRFQNRGNPPLVWLSSSFLPENTYFGLYRAILTSEEQKTTDFVGVLRRKQVEPIPGPKTGKDGQPPLTTYKGPHIFLCMIGGGHFAAMVVSLAPRMGKGPTAMNREAIVLAHKTFHRYTTRRKQGGAQSSNDSSKGNAHSAGSSLRRYNEQALVVDVRTLLQDWKALLDSSELLFVRATGSTNRRTLFGPYDGQVLQNNDTRLRGFPFSTKRATQKELMRCFIELTRLKMQEFEPEKRASHEASLTPEKKIASSKTVKTKLSEEEETALLHTSQLQAFVRRSKLPALLSYLEKSAISPDFEFYPREQNHHTPRLLHLAAAQCSAPLVLGLLVRAGANPLLGNGDGKVAFELAGDRSTRDAFRVARSELGEDKWAWNKAKVPTAMTKVEADDRWKRERDDAEKIESERRKAEEERLRSQGPSLDSFADKPKAKGNTLAASLSKTPQERREEEARGLTPEMRKRLERERRARAAEERMRSLRGSG
ncbi:hypothetical protein CDD82_6272 [Ophiocordyceps australis]|uniref:VLRF1 domain-containing protein n=1 Tax=Ophiocordyceps australis TaxID=1399860 RepID=A0A2C5XGU9_9HYPO|nr:hypothetical protein CDD82_6272 [Ophiocordyceps australis]